MISLRRLVAVVLLLVPLAPGCSSDPATPRGRAELFLDAHYVLIDLPRALTHTAGLARSKVEQEIELTKNQAAPESGERPSVHYRMLEEHPEGEVASNILFAADITSGSDRFERRWMVTVRKQDEGWRVTNFQEMAP